MRLLALAAWFVLAIAASDDVEDLSDKLRAMTTGQMRRLLSQLDVRTAKCGNDEDCLRQTFAQMTKAGLLDSLLQNQDALQAILRERPLDELLRRVGPVRRKSWLSVLECCCC